ncbi:polysaccharide biosynthesis tyrosine autokinase [Actinopolymorpha pittospori]
MTIASLLHILRTRWLVVVTVTLLAGVLATGYTWTRTPVYDASVQLFVSATTTNPDNSDLNQGGSFSQQRVKSYADIVTSPSVTTAVIASLRLPDTPEQLAGRITVESPLDTVLLNITVSDSSPRRARDIANAVGARFSTFVRALETPSGQASSPVRVTLTRPAVAPTSPASPDRVRDIALGLLVGLALGVAAAVLRHHLDRAVANAHAAAEIAVAPVIGTVAEETKYSGRLMADEGTTPFAEAFRRLATNVRFLGVERQASSLLVTCALPEEGKTTTAANLAVALAQAGERVVLIDADLRRPAVANVFGLSKSVGLSSVLMGDAPLTTALQRWRPDLPLFVLTAGPPPPNPTVLLTSNAMRELVRALESPGTTLLIDSPPLLPVTDPAVLAQIVDGVVVVSRVGSTRTDQLASAVDSLRTVGATVLGVVVNRVKKEKETTYSEYYHASPPGRNRARRNR